ncbi:MAG: hypothetical protein GDA46_02070 [Bdellovibrionales bacterium]|nr:hypothetical protein [Bdellovibrionales bacterium]
MKQENTNSGVPIFRTSTSLIESFLSSSKKLVLIKNKKENNQIEILQSHDRKSIFFIAKDIEKVLKREDEKGESFLQVNFKSGKKIILTEEFIGFPPSSCVGLSPHRLPKVVTTADLLSVIDAIESFFYGKDEYQESLHDVQLFFESIASGAEAIGFNLIGERLWVEKMIPNKKLLN